MAKRRVGLQPGQIGAVRFKDINTKGLPDAQALISDGQGGTRTVPASEIVGATQLDDLADIGTADETNGNVLVADGSKYQGVTPDAGGLVDKASAQDLTGIKTFQNGIRVDTIDSTGGTTISVNKRLVGQPAVGGNELATLNQVLGANSGVITVGHPSGQRVPDFSDLGEAIESVTGVGGGTIFILDSDSYQATGIDGVLRDLRNVVIVGAPGSDPAFMPSIQLTMDPAAAEDAGSSSAVLLPDEATTWHVVGCRIGPEGIIIKPSSSGINFGIILDECAFTDVDLFGVSAGAGVDEGCVEIKDTDTARVTVKNSYVLAGMRALSTKFICRSEGSTTKMWHTDLRPNDAMDLVPAVINNIQEAGAPVDIDLYFDKTLTVKTGTFGFIDPLQVDFGRKLSPVDHTIFNSRLLIGMDSGGTVDPEKIFIPAGMSMTAFEVAPEDTVSGFPELAIRLRVPTGGLTIDILASGVNGLDTGAEAANTWYHIYIIGDSKDVLPVAGLISLSTSIPTTPAGYDLCRRIGSVRNNAAGDFVTAFAEDGRVTYANDENTGITPSPTTVPIATAVAYGFGVLVPPTARRMELDTFFEVLNGTGAQELFIAHPDIVSVGGSSGGWRLAKISGTSGAGGRESQFSSRDTVDVDGSGIAHLYSIGTLTGTTVRFTVRGYTERL